MRKSRVLEKLENNQPVICAKSNIPNPWNSMRPGDLPQSLGSQGETNSPEILKVIDKVVKVCRKYNKPWGLPASKDNIKDYYELGARFFTVGADAVGVYQYFKDNLEAVQTELAGNTVLDVKKKGKDSQYES